MLASEELEYQSSLEDMLLFLENSALTFLISRREPDFLAMIYIILFWFLRDFSSFFRLFRHLMLLQSTSLTSNRSSHSILDRTFGAHTNATLVTMQYILVLRHSCLLAKHTVTLCAMVTVMCPSGDLLDIKTPVLALFFLWILTDLLLSDREAALAEAIFLICPAAIFLTSCWSPTYCRYSAAGSTCKHHGWRTDSGGRTTLDGRTKT